MEDEPWAHSNHEGFNKPSDRRQLHETLIKIRGKSILYLGTRLDFTNTSVDLRSRL